MADQGTEPITPADPPAQEPAPGRSAEPTPTAPSASPPPSAWAGDRAWLDRFVWTVLWKIVAVGVITAIGLTAVLAARHLIGLLIMSTFFALAIIPGIAAVQRRFGWKRGPSVAAIYLIGLTTAALLVAVLIPAIVRLGEAIGDVAPAWVDELNALGSQLLGVPVMDPATGQLMGDAIGAALVAWGDNVLGVLSSGIGVAFDLLTVASFTFYIAADYPKIERALMSRMPPSRQERFGWISEVSIEQTGGYFYSRLLLMVINSGLSFAVMIILGVPLVFAIPLALFMGFFAEFIPVIGTFIGAAIPIVVVLGVNGLGAALLLLVWVTLYQQVENLVLSPRLSAKTMELNGAVAFGGALAGGAIAGPMGAFMALPVAAMITAVIKNSGRTYEVTYRLKHDLDADRAPDSDL